MDAESVSACNIFVAETVIVFFLSFKIYPNNLFIFFCNYGLN